MLGSLIKSARDMMRKDKGLNGDIDRLPMLTWVMFLKFLDHLEHIHEQKAALAPGSTGIGHRTTGNSRARGAPLFRSAMGRANQAHRKKGGAARTSR